MTRKEMIMQMFLTQYTILSQDIDQLQRNLRYRHITTIDCLELIIAIERYEMLKEMQSWIFATLKIDDNEDFKKLFEKFERMQADRIKF